MDLVVITSITVIVARGGAAVHSGDSIPGAGMMKRSKKLLNAAPPLIKARTHHAPDLPHPV
jgi:hypothetical protein